MDLHSAGGHTHIRLSGFPYPLTVNTTCVVVSAPKVKQKKRYSIVIELLLNRREELRNQWIDSVRSEISKVATNIMPQ